MPEVILKLLEEVEWPQHWRKCFKAEEVCACFFFNYTVNTTAKTLKPDDLLELK